MPYRCLEMECRRRFSVRTRTVMESLSRGFQTWAIAAYLPMTSLKSVSSMKLHRDFIYHPKVGLVPRSPAARDMEVPGRPVPRPRRGRSDVLEQRAGGGGCPKARAARSRGAEWPARPIMAGVKDRRTNRVSAAMIENTDMETFTRSSRTAWRQMRRPTPTTTAAITIRSMTMRACANRSASIDAHIQGIESLRAMLKRAQMGTFHKISPKHIDHYFTEFAGRHNDRGLDTEGQLKAVVGGVV